MKTPGRANPECVTAVRPVVELAGIGCRLACMLYEALLLLGILFAFFLVPHLLWGYLGGKAVAGAWMWLHIFVLLGWYFVWYWCHHGQTLAMQTWRLRLVRADGALAVSVARAWRRYFLAWFSVLAGGLGLWWALVDTDHQFLHDRLAGTRLVRLPRLAKTD